MLQANCSMSESAQPEKKRRAVSIADVEYPTVPEEWYREREREVALEEGLLQFDADVTQGQIRPLSKASVEQRLREFRSALPIVPLRVTLWPVDVHGMFL